MWNAKWVVAAVFALTLGSGVVAGMLVSRLPSAGAASHPPGPDVAPTPQRMTMLGQALTLRADQQDEMQKIWERVRNTADGCYVRAQKLQRDQWNAMADLMTPDQKAKVNAIQSDYQKKFDELKEQREAEFKKAVEDTNVLLTPDQRKQFHDLIEKRLGETPPWLAPQKLPSGDTKAPPSENK